MFVVAGSGQLRIDGDEIELKPGRFVRLEPSAMRCPVAGPNGLTSSRSARPSTSATSRLPGAER